MDLRKSHDLSQIRSGARLDAARLGATLADFGGAQPTLWAVHSSKKCVNRIKRPAYRLSPVLLDRRGGDTLIRHQVKVMGGRARSASLWAHPSHMCSIPLADAQTSARSTSPPLPIHRRQRRLGVHSTCLQQVQNCSTSGDTVLLVAAGHRVRCITAAVSRCRSQQQHGERFSVDLAVLYGPGLLAQSRVSAVPVHRGGQPRWPAGGKRRHEYRL